LHFFPVLTVSNNYTNVNLNVDETSTPPDMENTTPYVQTVRTIDASCDQLAAERPHVGLDPATVRPAAPAHAAPDASGLDSGAESSDSDSTLMVLSSRARACVSSATKKMPINGKEKNKGDGESSVINNKKDKGIHSNSCDDTVDENKARGSKWAPYEEGAAFVAGRYTCMQRQMTKSEVESHCVRTYATACQEMVKAGYWKPFTGGHRTIQGSTEERCRKKGAVFKKYKDVRAIVVNEVIPLFHGLFKQGLPSGVQPADALLEVKQTLWSNSLTERQRSKIGATADMPVDWTSGAFIVFEIYGPLGLKDESVCIRLGADERQDLDYSRGAQRDAQREAGM